MSRGRWKLCPFCGGDSKTVWHLGTYWTVSCDLCLAEGPKADTEEEAIDRWNERRGEE